MRTPREVAAQAVRDELYALATFATLIALPPGAFRSTIESDPLARTEFMANHILNFYDDHYDDITPSYGLELIEAARVAAQGGEPHVRFRAEKELANELRRHGRFAEAESALERAEALAAQCCARGAHVGVAIFGRMALCSDLGMIDRAMEYAVRAISTLEENGLDDRAYDVGQFLAYMRYRQGGDNLLGLRSCEDALRLARETGSTLDIARARRNVGFSLRALGDYASAYRHFMEAAHEFRAGGASAPEAQALRCAARMAVRMHGASEAREMETAKALFLALDLAGEVCRCTLAVIQELIGSDPQMNVGHYCEQIEEEASSLGVLSAVRDSIERLKKAAADGHVTQEILAATWDAFGPSYSMPAVSDMTIVRN